MIEHYGINQTGRDFVVGDIHGCFTKLQSALDNVAFDTETDRLFAVGDLVDRGPESDEVVDWLSKPWFHSVRGNHDQFVVDYMEGPMDKGMYLLNGGKWFLDPGMTQDHRRYYYDAIKKLPILIEVETRNGLVGIVHADIAGDDWEDFKLHLEQYQMYAMWGRRRIQGKDDAGNVRGVYRVYAGHTPVHAPINVGNFHYIDVGVCFHADKPFHLEQIQ